LLRRISEWGIEKNVKQQERRAILQSLVGHGNIGDINTGIPEKRKFNKAKIERWRKIEEAGPSNISGNLGGFSKLRMLTRVKEPTARPITLVTIIRNILQRNLPTGPSL
jgi:hypothetical protein